MFQTIPFEANMVLYGSKSYHVGVGQNCFEVSALSVTSLVTVIFVSLGQPSHL